MSTQLPPAQRENLESQEWLEADGYGGFASGTVSGVRTRRYHALLLAAMSAPLGRVVLVNGLEAWWTTASGRSALSSQRYQEDVVHPDGVERLREFTLAPWPTWTFELDDGTRVSQELVVLRERRGTLLRWQRLAPNAASPVSEHHELEVRLLLSGRDFHALHRENPHFDFSVRDTDGVLRLRPYAGLPEVWVASNGRFTAAPCWYRNFHYSAEQARGLDHQEDLASPGVLHFDTSAGAAWLWLRALPLSVGSEPTLGPRESSAVSALNADFAGALADEREQRRARGDDWQAAAESYIVRRGDGDTIIAGYPWFGDWGRDTFIALRGLCLTRGQLETAGRILEQWAAFVSEGMLPNRFPDDQSAAEYNSVDAALWYVIAADDYLRRSAGADTPRGHRLLGAISAILKGYSQGTRFGIHQDEDALLACGVPGLQLTWMDAKVDAWVVTPRIGKPVEVQALWLNALRIGAACEPHYASAFERGCTSFRKRFWNAEAGALFDVVDVDHQPGAVDASLRPNQILAVGGLPSALFDGAEAQRIVACVEAELWTPLGLRTLSPADPRYRSRYTGGVYERDAAYHQGTAWPWLLGPFIQAWLRVYGATVEQRRYARQRFLEPWLAHLNSAGLGHVSEIADGSAPHAPAGAPFQAWSLGELIRAERWLRDDATTDAVTRPCYVP